MRQQINNRPGRKYNFCNQQKKTSTGRGQEGKKVHSVQDVILIANNAVVWQELVLVMRFQKSIKKAAGWCGNLENTELLECQRGVHIVIRGECVVLKRSTHIYAGEGCPAKLHNTI